MDISFYDAIQINSKLHTISWQDSVESGAFLFERVKLDLGHNANELKTQYHRHQNLEMHLVLTGNLAFSILETGENMMLDENSFVLISPDCVHSIESHSENMIKIGARFDVTEKCNKDVRDILLGCGYAAGKIDQHTQLVLSLLIDQCNVSSLGTVDTLQSMINILFYNVTRQIQADHVQPFDKRERDAFPPYVQEAITYIRENIRQPLNCAMVADHVGFSVRHMNRIILDELGISTYQLIMRIKHESARQLLLNTELSVARVSELMNFSSEYNFSHFFKHMEGISPANFRTENSKGMS